MNARDSTTVSYARRLVVMPKIRQRRNHWVGLYPKIFPAFFDPVMLDFPDIKGDVV